MKTKTLTIMKWSFEIALLMLISFIYYLNMIVVTPKVVYIPSGSISKIITQLSLQNYNVTKLDAIILRFLGSPQKGWIYIGSNKVTRADFLYRLTTAKAAMEDVTLIPGETTYIFLDQLSESLGLDRNLLQEYYDKYSRYKEGEFVPNTYKLPIGMSEENLIRTLLIESDKQMKELSVKIFGKYDRDKWFRYVTVASVIQKEAASIEEMPLVSSVIYNRIKKGMRLQMDGTLNYGKYSHTKITHERIKTDKSSYNTYIYSGIPNTPVCNVSFDAIKAAIFPAKTSYLYFVKGKNGKHIFSCNYSTHIKNINNATK
uniref:endolytic transglycosylase MltG n=1 Tax=Hydrocurvibacter mobilis TaxID=3131936 RepID=UPI003F6086EF